MKMTSQSNTPLVSIVTPCLNMADFIEETIQSVLTQDYPHIEYLVMDGGSTDATVEILKKYKDCLRFYSEPDEGVADAVNRGFRRSQGEIFSFLNADDCYLPGAVSRAVHGLLENPEAAVVYGDASWVDQQGKSLGDYPTKPFDAGRLSQECFICQPTTFIRRDVFNSVGTMNPELKFTFDYDLWIRIARRHQMLKLDERLAVSRMHLGNISLGSRRRVFKETVKLLQLHYSYVPFQLIHSYCSFLLDRRDQFFDPLRPSFLKYALSLPAGLYYNLKHPWRYLKEWASIMSMEAFKRRLGFKHRAN